MPVAKVEGERGGKWNSPNKSWCGAENRFRFNCGVQQSRGSSAGGFGPNKKKALLPDFLKDNILIEAVFTVKPTVLFRSHEFSFKHGYGRRGRIFVTTGALICASGVRSPIAAFR